MVSTTEAFLYRKYYNKQVIEYFIYSVDNQHCKNIMMFILKHVRVFEKSRTCLKKFMYVFFYKMIGIQLYMFKSYNNSTLQSFVIKDIADIYRVSKKRLKCDSKRRWGTMKIYYHHSICTL